MPEMPLYPGMEVTKTVNHADEAAPHLTEDHKGQRQVAAVLHTASVCACSSESVWNGPTSPAASCMRMGRGCQAVQ